MSAHISDELPLLLTGEASRDAVERAAEHLRGCTDCQQELVSAVVAHASLMSARRFAPERADRPQASERADAPAHPLPDLSAVLDQIRTEKDEPRWPRSRVLLAAAAAVVVVGGGVAGGVLATGGSGGPAARTVALVGPGHTTAAATLIGGDHMRIDATALPRLDAGHQYEVWLTNASGSSMQAVGFIRADRHADIQVPAPLMQQYQDIAVSVQGVRQTQFSGKVVLQGSYE
jgi:hypothetical protein